VRYNENFVLVSPRPESPKRERGSVEISLAGASGSHPSRLGDIKGRSPWLVGALPMKQRDTPMVLVVFSGSQKDVWIRP